MCAYPVERSTKVLTMIRRSALLIVCLLASTNRVGRADGYNVKREIGWARSMWPADLKDVQFQSPTAKMLDWARPGGSIKVWLFSQDHACTEVELHRVTLSTPTPAGDTEVLIGKHFASSGTPGATSRSYAVTSLGFLFAETDDHCQEDIASEAPVGCGGVGREGPTYGALSDVDQESAGFDGEQIGLDPQCAGPVQWLKCESGGKRPCVGCRRVAISPIETSGSSYGDYRKDWIPGADRRRATCNEACPAQSSSPTLRRIEELERRTHMWRRRNLSLAEVPTLHRTLAGCMRTHFTNVLPPSPTAPRPGRNAK
jgi:hypothetical protein